MKSNTELVKYCKAQVGKPYWFGTFGQTANTSLLSNKAKQYPKYYGDARVAKAKKEHLGQRVHDCMGLVKGFLWSDNADSSPKYKASEDWSADATFEKAAEKGAIATIPEIAGLCVRYKGHVGVYIGNGEVIEARGFDYGVVKTKLNARKWTHWYKHPLITYEASGAIVSDSTYTVKKGDTLSKIAKQFNTSVDAIAKKNNISDVNMIQVGQVLHIDGGQSISNIDERQYVYVKVNTVLNCRNSASMNGKVICTFKNETKLELIDNLGDWCKVKYGSTVGYCSSKYLR